MNVFVRRFSWGTAAAVGVLCAMSWEYAAAQEDEGVRPPPDTLPSLPHAGASIIDPTFGHRIIRLTDESLCPGGATTAYSYWPSLNADNTRLLVGCNGVSQLAVDLEAGTVQSMGQALQAVPLWWEGTMWSPTNPHIGYGLYGSTGQPRIYAYNFTFHSADLLVDLLTVQEYTDFWGSGDTYLWQMSMSRDEGRFAASVRQSGTYAYLGAVVWEDGTNQVWNYRVPPGEAMDEVQLDRTGVYLLIKLLRRRWQVWKLSEPAPSAVMPDSPGHSDTGNGVVFNGHGTGLSVYSLEPPYASAGVYSAPRVESKRNPYADGHTSLLAPDGWAYYETYTDGGGGGVRATWVQHSGSVYQVDWNSETNGCCPHKRLPEVVRMGRTALQRVSQIPTGPGEWFLDGSTLYVWNPGGEDPNTVSMIVFDWRPTHEELVRVRLDGSEIQRLAHHRSHVFDYGDQPRANVSFDGRYYVFSSNWGGRDRVDVYAVEIAASSVVDTIPPPQVQGVRAVRRGGA